jgi:CheY-like chemotaxis protein
MKKIRVMLADDHPIVMTGFAMSLEGQGLEVVAQARTPDEALAQYRQLQPDVIVLDIRFGEQLTGLDVAKQILAHTPSAAIVFLSQFDQDSLIKETYRLGGRAFMTKDCDPADLAAAVRRAWRRAVLPAAYRRAAGQFVGARRGLAAVAAGPARAGNLYADGGRPDECRNRREARCLHQDHQQYQPGSEGKAGRASSGLHHQAGGQARLD